MSDNKLRAILLFTSVMLIVIVLAFGCMLNIASFKKNYVESLASSYKISTLQGKGNIEYAIRYGKPLDKFFGIEEILKGVKKNLKDVDDIRIALVDGKILYNLSGQANNDRFSPQFIKLFQFGAKTQSNNSAIVLSEGKYHLLIPIRDKKDTWIGTIDLSFRESTINAYVDVYLWEIIRGMLIIAALSTVLLAFLFWLVAIIDRSGSVMRKRLIIILFAVFGVTQTVYSIFNVNLFQAAYMDIANSNMALVAKSVKSDIEFVVDKGVPYSRLIGLDEYLNRVIAATPEIKRMVLVSDQGKAVVKTSMESSSDELETEDASYSLPLSPDKQGITTKLELFLSTGYIAEKIHDIWLDAVTVAVLTFFLMFELVNFMLLVLKRKPTNVEEDFEERAINVVNFVRPAAFLFFMGSDMSLSFIPIYMRKLYNGDLGVPISIAMGVPISAEMLFAGIASMVGGFWVDKRGWRMPFFVGTVIICGGALFSGFAQTAVTFIAARGIVGIGYGLAWMALRGYIGFCPTPSGKATGFSQFAAGIQAGSACGCALGPMLAERLGYANVFFIALIMIASAACFVWAFVKNFDVAKESKVSLKLKKTGRRLDFFCDAKAFAVLFLYIIPSTICTVGFLNYFFPIYSGSIGVSPANTGRAFMIYAICIIYLGTFVGKYIAKHGGEKAFLVIAGMITALSMLVFSFTPGFIVAIMVIFMLGASDSIGAVAQNTFYLSLDSAHILGEGKALAFAGLVRKIGQTLGPMAFGGVIASAGIVGIGWVGGVYIAMLLLFIFLTRRRSPDRGLV